MDAIGHETGYAQSWLNCFKGSFTDPGSNLRRTLLGISAQMMQQWTGINFIFYFGTVFFQSLGMSSGPDVRQWTNVPQNPSETLS